MEIINFQSNIQLKTKILQIFGYWHMKIYQFLKEIFQKAVFSKVVFHQ